MQYTLSNFIGQKKLKEKLKIFIYPKFKNPGYCDHILLEGQSGTGKTTLAYIFSNENNLPIKVMIAALIKSKADLLSIFCDLEPNTLVFIDEIHRLDVHIEEMLYQILDDKKINISVGKEGDNSLITFDIPNFTLIGATTLTGLMSKPLKDRFGFRMFLEDYKIEDIKLIIKQNLVLDLSEDLVTILGKNCKETPRIAKNLAKRINDYYHYWRHPILLTDVKKILELVGYKKGLNQQDLKYLELFNEELFLSITSISQKLGMEKINIITDIEPFLIKQNYISINSKGRSITKKGQKFITDE